MSPTACSREKTRAPLVCIRNNDMNVLVVSLTLVVRFEMVMLWTRVFCLENGDFRRLASTVHGTSRSSWRQCSNVSDNNNNTDEHLLLFVTIHTYTIPIIKYCIFTMLFRTIKLSNEINNLLHLIYNLLQHHKDAIFHSGNVWKYMKMYGKRTFVFNLAFR